MFTTTTLRFTLPFCALAFWPTGTYSFPIPQASLEAFLLNLNAKVPTAAAAGSPVQRLRRPLHGYHRALRPLYADLLGHDRPQQAVQLYEVVRYVADVRRIRGGQLDVTS